MGGGEILCYFHGFVVDREGSVVVGLDVSCRWPNTLVVPEDEEHFVVDQELAADLGKNNVP